MNTTTAPATLLIFTLGASAERRRRRLLPGAHGGQELALHQQCLDLAFAAGRANGCRLLVSSPGATGLPEDTTLLPQQGSGFGERLATASAEARRIADGPLVVLGSDVPGVRPRHVAKALDQLAADRDSVVLGPSPDGGLYLLASHRPLDHLLAGVSWCQRNTRRRLTKVLRSAGLKVSFLEPLRDLDDRTALETWLSGSSILASFKSLLEDPLLALAHELRSILTDLRRPWVPSQAPCLVRVSRSTAPGRAPPSRF